MSARVCAALLLAGAAAGPPPVDADEAKPVRVYVFPRAVQPVDPAERKTMEREASAAQKRAQQVRKDLEKTLEARHGKNVDRWPAEARSALADARTAAVEASVAHRMVTSDAKEIASSVEHLRKALTFHMKEEPAVVLAESAEEADLGVEVLARHASTRFPAAAWRLYLKVTPVGFADHDGFAGKGFTQAAATSHYLGQIMGTWRTANAVTSGHAFSRTRPYWTIEVYQQGVGWGDVASSAAQVLVAFAKDLKAPPPAGDAAARAAERRRCGRGGTLASCSRSPPP